MFAYIFWHRRDERFSVEEYESKLAGFHRALLRRGQEGYLGSIVFKITGTPWVPQGGYEDWYLVEGLRVLEELNASIGLPDLEKPHSQIASMALEGKGAILAPRTKTPGSLDAPRAVWFSKPRGQPYHQFYREIEPVAETRGAGLWRRQLALGPTPEFLLLSSGEVPLPEKFAPIGVERVVLLNLYKPTRTP